MHKAHRVSAHVVGVQSANEQLIVSFMNGVAALEGQHIHSLWQGVPHLHKPASIALCMAACTVLRCDHQIRFQPSRLGLCTNV